MGHLQIAYYLFVILIGLIALSIAGFWAQKTREVYLRDFCILYILFTAALIFTLFSQYLIINVENYSLTMLFWILGTKQVINFAVVVAAIRLLLEIYGFAFKNKITIAFLVLMAIASLFMFTPIGATLDVERQGLQLGFGYQIASGIYFLSFTFVIIFGFTYLRRVSKTRLFSFTIGLLIFACVGYIETTLSMIPVIREEPVALTDTAHFLVSSIPYAFYGIFLVNYFLNTPVPIFLDMSQIPESFFQRYAITDREKEIIQCVVEGKSNAEIAEELVISLATVKTHLHNIYGKFDIDSRYDLIAKIRQSQ
jgi:DNA-binding CsgD family transcriptional regulator